MKKTLGIFLIILILFSSCAPTVSQDVPFYNRSLIPAPTSTIVSQVKRVPDEAGYHEKAVTADGKRILSNDYDYKVVDIDGTLICQYNSVQWIPRTRAGIIHALYIAMKRSDDGVESYFLLDDNFQPVGETYRYIYHYGHDYGQFDTATFSEEDDYYVASKDGNVYKITPSYTVTELKHAGPTGEYLLNGKYQMTHYWLDVNYSFKGLLDSSGNIVLACEYLHIYEVLPNRIKAVTGDSFDSSLARVWLFDENLRLLTNQYNDIFFIVSKDGYIGVGYSEGNTSSIKSGMADPGRYFVDKDGIIVSKSYASIGNIVEGDDYVLKNDPTLDFVCTLPDGTTQVIPFADVMIPFK